ncbi:hypothetical protein MettiDRAFT_2419 [Methanolobus tindarius DSM 2278]|jgi:hypothetical protein|uniref:Uncharacterized protein n=1 Tax=Methanolobus tindarius DSM 2278 TaxID=1090322 RepID=W9DTG2_METTI|nr:hypothetical protein MettiDRAFT_2419 [Methanolobus tindarius DSM 2278]
MRYTYILHILGQRSYERNKENEEHKTQIQNEMVTTKLNILLKKIAAKIIAAIITHNQLLLTKSIGLICP